MTTTITSTILNVDVGKLKRELEAIPSVIVLEIRPHNGVQTEVDLEGTVTGGTLTAAQTALDNHIDNKEENIRFRGNNQNVLENAIAGEILFRNPTDVWKIDVNNTLLPVNDNSYDLGDATHRIKSAFFVDSNFSGDVVITGNLTVNGTQTSLNTQTLEVEDDFILLNSAFTTGTPVAPFLGIEALRGDDPSAKLQFNETTDKWEFGIDGSMSEISSSGDLTTHINDTANPHSVTKAQVGLSNVTNDAQLTRSAGDFGSFPTITSIDSSDIFLLEDADDSFNKKDVTFGSINSSLDHQSLSGAGTNDHAAIDSHIANTSNPHSVDKTDVGLGNVTDDAQLTRAADDFISFPIKNSSVNADKILIEDSEDSGAKKYIELEDLPFPPPGELDGKPLPVPAPADGETLEFDSGGDAWIYVENNNAKKIQDIVVEAGPPLDGEFIKYNSGSGEFEFSSAPGISSSGPIGSIIPFGSTTPPTGFLNCDGSDVSRTTYADLFAVIGTTFGVGDGSTTFTLPDLRQRFPLGKADSGTGSTLGSTGGAIDHVHQGGSHSHDMGNHTHNVGAHYHGLGTLGLVSSGDHDHSINHDHSSFTSGGSGTLNTNSDSHSHTVSGSTNTTGNHSHQYNINDAGPFATEKGIRGGADAFVEASFTEDAGNHSHTVSGSTNSDSHSHTIPTHTHSINVPNFTGTSGDGGDHTHTLTGLVGATGGSAGDSGFNSGVPSDNNTSSGGVVDTSSENPPFLAVNYIIKFSDNILAQGDQNISGNITFSDTVKQKSHLAFANSESTEYTKALETTNDTPTAIDIIPAFANSSMFIEVDIISRLDNVAVDKSYWATIKGAIIRNSTGNVAIVGTEFIAEDDIGSPGYDVSLVASGTDVEIQVTGGSGETVVWVAKIRHQSVLTSS